MRVANRWHELRYVGWHMIRKPQIQSVGRSSYTPEDNKIRLYVSRVPRDEYEKLRADGWTATPKQNCNFVATWTPSRRDTALEYGGGVIEDEDQPAQDRAADRAERFSGYRDKREGEAISHADRFDSGPQAHGYQSAARAERSALRHDRIASHAVDAWSKAEYWQERTARVISHALYISRPDVRMGRIKTLEAELRKCRVEIAERTERFQCWQRIAAKTDTAIQDISAKHCADYEHGKYKHPITGEELSLYQIAASEGITGAQIAALWLANHTEPAQENDWTIHLTLRLAYENQMLESQGGRAAHVEMVCGGFIGGRQIYRVNKSNVTGRVVSVALRVPRVGEGWHYRIANVPGADYALEQMDTERLPAGAYRPPTPEELITYEASRKAEKAAKPKAETIPLINPTDADAEHLQAIWNERAQARHAQAVKEHRTYGDFKPTPILRVTKAVYSANSKGSFGKAETRGICRDGEEANRATNMYSTEREARAKRIGPAVCNIRIAWNGASFSPDHVIVITDKPQKPLPAAVWENVEAVKEPVAVNPNAGILAAYPGGRW